MGRGGGGEKASAKTRPGVEPAAGAERAGAQGAAAGLERSWMIPPSAVFINDFLAPLHSSSPARRHPSYAHSTVVGEG